MGGLFVYKGNTYTMAELARKTGVNYGLLKNRLLHGWAVDMAVSREVKK